MRSLPVAVAAALALVSLSASLSGQRPAAPVSAQSVQLLAQGRALRAAGDLDGATDAVEAAVTADPRNRAAFILLAQIAESRGLPGKAIRLYRQALQLDPNDVAALSGQGAALVQKGAINKARENLARIRTLCRAGCGEATQLAAAIAKGPPVATASATTDCAITPSSASAFNAATVM